MSGEYGIIIRQRLFAAGLSSILSVPTFMMTMLSIVSSGICYDAIKDLFLNSKGGHIMRDMSIVLLCWLCCCGNVV